MDNSKFFFVLLNSEMNQQYEEFKGRQDLVLFLRNKELTKSKMKHIFHLDKEFQFLYQKTLLYRYYM